MPNDVQIPCSDPDHAMREGQPGWSALTPVVRTFPDGHTPTAEELSGYLCDACARAQAEAAQPAPPPDPPEP